MVLDIPGKANGSILRSDSNGKSSWVDKNYLFTKPNNYRYIGEFYGGGIIVAMWKYPSNVFNYLIMSTSDVGAAAWSNGATHWLELPIHNGDVRWATNTSGFTALPGGFRYANFNNPSVEIDFIGMSPAPVLPLVYYASNGLGGVSFTSLSPASATMATPQSYRPRCYFWTSDGNVGGSGVSQYAHYVEVGGTNGVSSAGVIIHSTQRQYGMSVRLIKDTGLSAGPNDVTIGTQIWAKYNLGVTTYINGEVNTPNGIERFDNARLNEISRSLTNLQPPPDAPDETPAGPAEVEERLFAANRSGASHAPLDWAIVSLCLVGNRFENHKLRREIYLIDQPSDANPDLEVAVNDAVTSIDAFLDEGHTVLVHCHGGRSRTGLILKAWKMKKEGWSGTDGEQRAHMWLSQKWNLYTNTHFRDYLINM